MNDMVTCSFSFLGTSRFSRRWRPCNVLPRIPLAALFDGAAFTQPRGPQNWRNNAVRTKFTMCDLPQPH